MTDKTLYVVSGYMRTGTSMMMKALEIGGLTAEYKQSRDEMKDRFADEFYDPNIGGLYELERQDYTNPNFPKGYEGKLIKALAGGVDKMKVMPDGIRVIFMRRDTEEIRQSYQAFFGTPLRHDTKTLQKTIDLCIERGKNRKDVISYDEIWYRDVVENPRPIFEKLDWPIDVDKSVSMIDKKYCRFKLEELDVGIR